MASERTEVSAPPSALHRLPQVIGRVDQRQLAERLDVHVPRGEIDQRIRQLAERPHADAAEALQSIRGIGPWTANHVVEKAWGPSGRVRGARCVAWADTVQSRFRGAVTDDANPNHIRWASESSLRPYSKCSLCMVFLSLKRFQREYSVWF